MKMESWVGTDGKKCASETGTSSRMWCNSSGTITPKESHAHELFLFEIFHNLFLTIHFLVNIHSN